MEKVKILSILDNLIPSNIIGVIRPMLELQKRGLISFKLRYTIFYSEKDIASCDILILCRNICVKDLNILEYAKKYNKKIIYDIDDNFFDISVKSALGRYHRVSVHLYTLVKMIESASCVRVYSHIMEKKSLAINSNTQLVNSYFDFNLLEKVIPVSNNSKIRIVFASSRSDDVLESIYLPAIKKILQEYPDKVEYYQFGLISDSLKFMPNVYNLKIMPNYNDFIHFFYRQGFDIGLAPLVDDVFHNSKTNNKFREYGAMRVAGIYSSTPVYADCVENYQTGVLVENTTEEWYCALKTLVESPELLENIKTNAQQNVKNKFSFESTVQTWKDIISASMAETYTKCKYANNILRLRVALIIDLPEHSTSQLRVKPVASLLGFSKISYQVILWQDVSVKMANEFDIIIYFPNPTMPVQPHRIILLCEFFQNVIVDIVRKDFEMPSCGNLIVTSSFESDNQRIIKIPTESFSVNDNLLDLLFNNSILLNNDICDMSLNCESAYKDKMECFYSTDSPVFMWGMLLEQYEGHKVDENMLERITKKIAKYFIRVGKFLVKPFVAGFKKISNKVLSIKRKSNFLLELFKINVFKKY